MDESLTHLLNVWSSQAVAAAFFLAPFYRRLEDESQACRAMQASKAPMERVERLGLGGLVQLRLRGFRMIPEELEAEMHGWRSMVAALGGLYAFYSFAEKAKQGRSAEGVRGPRNALHRGLKEALRGFRAAFPESFSQEGIGNALEEVARTVAGVIVQTSDLEAPEEARAELHRIILESFQGF